MTNESSVIPELPAIPEDKLQHYLGLFYRDVLRTIALYDGTYDQSAVMPRVEVHLDLGLCTIMYQWANRYLPPEVSGIEKSEWIGALGEYQTKLFVKAGLDSVLPFNESNYLFNSGYEIRYSNYVSEKAEGRLYENPARLDWIKKHAAPETTTGNKD